MKKTQNLGKKAVAIAACAGVVAGGLLGATVFQPEPQVIVQNDTVIKEVPVEVIKNVTVVEEVEVPVEVEVIKEVDNEKLDDLVQYLYDEDGDVEFLFDDLDEEDQMEILDRMILIQNGKELAVKEVKAELFDELDKEVFNSTITFDEDDLEDLDFDDFEDFEISDIDFDDDQFTVKVFGDFEQDDVDFEFEVDVEVKEGKTDDFDVISITEK
jgi:hypothetical protein